jgi:preprotein translocase subunit SecB
MQLKPSPIQIIRQEVVEVAVHTHPAPDQNEPFGRGKLDVERTLIPCEDHPRQFAVSMKIDFSEADPSSPPPYSGSISLVGVYVVHESFPKDPERLIRITGASMLYGVGREMISHITARSPNGILTLPSVSFIEDAPEPKPAKKAAKKKGGGK